MARCRAGEQRSANKVKDHDSRMALGCTLTRLNMRNVEQAAEQPDIARLQPLRVEEAIETQLAACGTNQHLLK
jgi:hypothetical protein